MRTTLFSLLLTFTFALGSAHTTVLDPPTAVKVVEVDFPIFKDKDFKIIYLDFELLTTNVKSLQIIKNKSNIAFTDDVSKVSVDGIYEIDYSEYSAGQYDLELLTYTGERLRSTFVIE
ncbi:hypothetical protein [Portibacter marinus]|uniref:hypothetical protein n=1 Tax=Portibacter marinus TaxID=2898660 RepID=UPI001F387A4F|nr:hypothetical protein [Portibacter marinus]